MIARLVALCLLCAAATPAFARPPLYPEEVRAAFKKQLARAQEKRPLPLDIRKHGSKKDSAGNPYEKVSIASEKKPSGKTERIPMLVMRPQKARGKRPAVIVVHETGGNKEGQLAWLGQLAGKGIIGVAIDARHHGARAPGGAADAYDQAILEAWRAPAETQEHPFLYDTVWDVWRVVDYLHKRSDVDKNKVGMIGFSMGGIVTWLAAAADERIKVAVPVLAVQSFRWSLDNEQWQAGVKTMQSVHDAAAQDLKEPKVTAKVAEAVWRKLAPGIVDSYDAPSMLRLFPPRALLILNGAEDPSCPIGGARIAFAAASSAYRAKEASEKLKVVVSPGLGHEVTDEHRAQALDWFEEWFKLKKD